MRNFDFDNGTSENIIYFLERLSLFSIKESLILNFVNFLKKHKMDKNYEELLIGNRYLKPKNHSYFPC